MDVTAHKSQYIKKHFGITLSSLTAKLEQKQFVLENQQVGV